MVFLCRWQRRDRNNNTTSHSLGLATEILVPEGYCTSKSVQYFFSNANGFFETSARNLKL